VTPAESKQITDLTTRLFGDDGEGGALGRIEHKLDHQDGRILSLERERIAREAVNTARGALDNAHTAKRRWQATAALAAIGMTISGFVGLANLFGWVKP
jgi:hypothetical protein